MDLDQTLFDLSVKSFFEDESFQSSPIRGEVGEDIRALLGGHDSGVDDLGVQSTSSEDLAPI